MLMKILQKFNKNENYVDKLYNAQQTEIHCI